MLKYYLLVILNTPFIIFGMLRALRLYNQKAITKLRLVGAFTLWTAVFLGLVFAQPLYEALAQSGLTDSTPLSLFDVVQITGIILALFLVTRLYGKTDTLETRINQLNRELSIANVQHSAANDKSNAKQK